VLKKGSPNKNAGAKRDQELTDHEGQIIVEILSQTVDVAMLALRHSMAVSEALISKGALNKNEIERHMLDSLPETTRLMELLDEIQESLKPKPS